MTDLKKEEIEESFLEKKELSYREQKAFERKKKGWLESIENLFFFAQDKLTKERQNEMGFSSKVLVALGSTFNDVSKWNWPKVSKDYQPRITNAEFYAEVHDRVLGSHQPSRFKAKYISAKYPEVLKTNIMVSKMRMKLFEFNGYTSAIVSFFILIGAATLSSGITYTKAATSEGMDAVSSAFKNETVSDYFQQLKDYNLEQLKAEGKAVKEGSGNINKIAVIDYYSFKIAKKDFEAKYPAGTDIPEIEKQKYKVTVDDINSKLALIKSVQNEKVLKHEEKKQGDK